MRRAPPDPVSSVHLAPLHEDLFTSPGLLRALQRLHAPVTRGTQRLHAHATVHASVREAGLFTPVYLVRHEVPEVVVLIQRSHQGDHLAGLAELLVQRLLATDLIVETFQYLDDPRRLSDSAQRPTTLPLVAARHPGARLLVVGEAAAFLNLWDGELLPWTEILSTWDDRSLLSAEASQPAHQQLVEGGFAVWPLSSLGITAMAERLAGASVSVLPEDPWPLPAEFAETADWLNPLPPPGWQGPELLATLRDYLSGPGLLVLAAMAAYPHLNWGLTRALDLSLHPGGAGTAQREARLLRIARLPWCRGGWLPDWLRDALLRDLSPVQHARVRGIYQNLFEQLESPGVQGIELPLASKPPRQGFVRYLRALLRGAPPDSAFNDRIFANLLIGQRAGLLDFELLRKRAALLPGLSWISAALPVLLVLLLSGGGCWLSWWSWTAMGKSGLESLILAGMRAEHQSIRVTIEHAPNTQVLANSLASTLQQHGFGEVTNQAMPVRQVKGEALAQDSIDWGSGISPAQAGYVAERLGFLHHATPLSLAARQTHAPDLDPDQIRVRVQQPPRALAGFRDRLDRPLDAVSWQAVLDTLRPQSAGAEADPAKAKIQPILPDMVDLPGGSFLMGSPETEQGRGSDEGPQHKVAIQAFAIGRYEVTFDEYDRFAEATDRAKPDDKGWGRGRRPVIIVSWQDATAYAAWLSARTGQDYRLPSEAEWEYATRAGATSARFWGDDPAEACNYANVNDQTEGKPRNTGWAAHDCDDGEAKTALVGRYAANAFGLNDMLGNVWEWTQDCWHTNYEGAPDDGSAWEEAGSGDCAWRMVRGGGWVSYPEVARSADRSRSVPHGADTGLGFRLARTL